MKKRDWPAYLLLALSLLAAALVAGRSEALGSKDGTWLSTMQLCTGAPRDCTRAYAY